MNLEQVTKRAAKLMKLGAVPKVKVRSTRRGVAHPESGWFSIPKWATDKHPAFATVYVIHELAHFATGYSKRRWTLRGHGKEFRRIEHETAEKFGLRLEYRGTAYLAAIRELETNTPLCDGYGRPIIDFQI